VVAQERSHDRREEQRDGDHHPDDHAFLLGTGAVNVSEAVLVGKRREPSGPRRSAGPVTAFVKSVRYLITNFVPALLV
jgi:hypothetical protein